MLDLAEKNVPRTNTPAYSSAASVTNKKRFPATAGFDEQQNFPGSFEADRNSKSEARAGGQGQVRAGVQVIKCSCFVIYGGLSGTGTNINIPIFVYLAFSL